jgi:methylthioribose-1-phosphate isomerase
MPEGVQGRYPAFDVTPASHISYLIGFDGVLTPEDFRKRHQKTTPSRDAKKKGSGRFLLLYGIPRQDSYTQLSHRIKNGDAECILLPEMRPELFGLREIAQQLGERNIPTTLISDNMMGTFFAQGEIRRLYLYYDKIGEKGPEGICGSLLVAHLARAHGVPVEVLASGDAMERPLDRNVSSFLGHRVISEGVAAYPIENEVIPWSLLRESQAVVS